MAGVEQRPEHPQVIKTEALNGDEYQATFRGDGWISSGHDDGTFIASVSYAEMERQWDESRAKPDSEESEVQDFSFLDRHLLDMAGLFPKDWREKEIEFEISVKARRMPQDSGGE